MRRARRVVVIRWTGLAVTFALLAACSGSSGSRSSGGVPSISATTKDGSASVRIARSDTNAKEVSIAVVDAPGEPPAEIVDSFESIEAIQVELPGALTGEAKVAFKVPDDLNPDEEVPVVLWQKLDGSGWEMLPIEWAPGDSTVVATTTHFSLGWFGKINLKKAVKWIRDHVMSGLGLEAGIGEPTCEGNDGLTSDGYSFESDSSGLVKWCVGKEDGKAVLKVSNNWGAGQSVIYPSSWTLLDGIGNPSFVVRFAQWVGRLGESIPKGKKVGVIPSGETYTFDISADGDSTKSVELQPSVMSWTGDVASGSYDYLTGMTGWSVAKLLGKTPIEGFEGLFKCYAESRWGVMALFDQPKNPDDLEALRDFTSECAASFFLDTRKYAPGANGGVAGALLIALPKLMRLVMSAARSLWEDVASLVTHRTGGIATGYTIRVRHVALAPVVDTTVVQIPTVALGCGSGCTSVASIPVTHPTLGAGTFGWFGGSSSNGYATDAAFALAQGPVWSQALTQDDAGIIIAPAADAAGRVFGMVNFEGSGSCALAWIPTDTGYTQVARWSDICGYDFNFKDVDSDGTFEIERLNYGIDCPTCTDWDTGEIATFQWDGTAFSKIAQRGPVLDVPLAKCVADELSFAMDGHEDEVALYQYTLKRLGYDPGDIDGIFGETTWESAQDEIADNGVSTDGNGNFVEIFWDDGTILRPAFVRLGIAC